MKEAIEFFSKHRATILFIVGVIAAGSIIPYRLKDVEAGQVALKEKDEQHDEQLKAQAAQTTALYEQTTAINSLIQSEREKKVLEDQHEKEMREAAPPGMVWDSFNRKYIKGDSA